MLLAGLLLVAAVLLGRVDLVVLAAPFALGTAFALRRRPRGAARRSGHRGRRTSRWSRAATVAATVEVGNPDTVGYDLAVVRPVSPWLRSRGCGSGATARTGPRGGRPAVRAAVPVGTAVDLELAGTALRWGRHPVGPAGATRWPRGRAAGHAGR